MIEGQADASCAGTIPVADTDCCPCFGKPRYFFYHIFVRTAVASPGNDRGKPVV
jgi:hypothetical protein